MLLASLIVVGFTNLQAAKPQIGSLDLITRSRLKAHLEFIAHDLLEGRDTPSRGQDIAAMYVATQLKLWGAKPGGQNGSYFQDLPLQQDFVDRTKTSLTLNGQSIPFGADWYAALTPGTISAPVVYVGHGVVWKAKGIDPYAGIDVKGKVVLAVGLPDALPNFALSDGTAQSPEESAAQRGAIGLIKMESVVGFNYLNIANSFCVPGSPRIAAKSSRPVLITIGVSPTLGAKILGKSATETDRLIANSGTFKKEDAFESTAKCTVTIGVIKRSVPAKNVIAIIPGTDPKLSSQYVGFGAHIDHVGIDDSVTGDQIFNGADDDGSGTVALLEMAHAFAVGKRPKRSLIFVWHTGEEKGLWGSAYFTEHPTVNLKSVIAMLNIDMIGRSRPKDDKDARNNMLTGENAIYVVGSRRIAKELGDVCESVNNSLYKMKYDFHYDRPNDPENIYERSDHYNYALKGIPIAFWFDGVHADYHQVSDHVEKIDFTKMECITRTVYATGWALGNRATKLK